MRCAGEASVVKEHLTPFGRGARTSHRLHPHELNSLDRVWRVGVDLLIAALAGRVRLFAHESSLSIAAVGELHELSLQLGDEAADQACRDPEPLADPLL
jgi:hypothetical protein